MQFQKWMEQNLTYSNPEFRYICLPASHDSGTYALQPVMTDEDGEKSKYWYNKFQAFFTDLTVLLEPLAPYIGNVPELIESCLYTPVNGLSQATTRTILQQLNDGVRCLDLRIQYQNGTFYTYHGLLGSPLFGSEGVFTQIQQFLSETDGEIVYVTLSHFNDLPKGSEWSVLTGFAESIVGLLGDYAYVYQYPNSKPSTLFDQTYTSILSEGGPSRSRVILVAGWMNTVPVNEIYYFWPIPYSPPDSTRNKGREPSDVVIYGRYYGESTELDVVLEHQQENLTQALTENKPFALYLTITPTDSNFYAAIMSSISATLTATADALPRHSLGREPIFAVAAVLRMVARWLGGSTTLLAYSQEIDVPLESLMQQDFLPLYQQSVQNGGAKGNPFSMIYVDYYETSTVVSLAIDLSNGVAYAWTTGSPLSFASSPNQNSLLTNLPPTVAGFGQQLWLAYVQKGQIQLASASPLNGGDAWSLGLTLGNGSVSGVTMVADLDQLYLAWAEDACLSFETYDGSAWTYHGAVTVKDGGTAACSSTPALVSFRDVLYLIYRVLNANSMAYLTYDPKDGRWNGPFAVADESTGVNPQTGSSPTATVYDDVLYVSYLDSQNSDDVYLCSFDGNNWSGGKPVQVRGQTVESQYPPALAVCRGQIYMVYKGKWGNDLEVCQFNGNQWNGNSNILSSNDPTSDIGPAMANFQDELYLIYKQQGTAKGASNDANYLYGAMLQRQDIVNFNGAN